MVVDKEAVPRIENEMIIPRRYERSVHRHRADSFMGLEIQAPTAATRGGQTSGVNGSHQAIILNEELIIFTAEPSTSTQERDLHPATSTPRSPQPQHWQIYGEISDKISPDEKSVISSSYII